MQKKSRKDNALVQAIEHILWSTRWCILLAICCSILSAFMMFYVSAVDTFYAVDTLMGYYELSDSSARAIMRGEAEGMVVKVIDMFLLAVVLLIFGLGLYELYISKIDHAYESYDETAAHMLSVGSLDDLKSRLGKVIMMILVVKFFELAIAMNMGGIEGLLIFSIGTLMIAFTLYLSDKTAHKSGKWKTRSSDLPKQTK